MAKSEGKGADMLGAACHVLNGLWTRYVFPSPNGRSKYDCAAFNSGKTVQCQPVSAMPEVLQGQHVPKCSVMAEILLIEFVCGSTIYRIHGSCRLMLS